MGYIGVGRVSAGRGGGAKFVRGLLGTAPPDLTLEFASPSPLQGVNLASKQGQIRKSMSNRCRIDP